MPEEKTETTNANAPLPETTLETPPTQDGVSSSTILPKPPVSHIMPHAPAPVSPQIDPPVLTTPTLADTIQGELAESMPGLTMPKVETFATPKVVSPKPVRDSIEEEVGLTRPSAKIPLPHDGAPDYSKILASIKLPEKRDAHTAADTKPIPTTPRTGEKTLDDVLAATITERPARVTDASENSTSASPQNLSAGIDTQRIPNQEVFHEEMSISGLHTLKQDLQHVVLEQKMSVVRAVALEEEKKSHDPHLTSHTAKEPSKVPGIIVMLLALIALGGATLGAVFYTAQYQSTNTSAPQQDAAIIFAEQMVPFNISGNSPQTLKAQLAQVRGAGGTLGSILHIVPTIIQKSTDGSSTERPATLAEFFTAIGATPPENLMRALSETFFLGIHTVDKNVPVLIISVDAYDRAFDGMLSWEKTLNADLAPLFVTVPRLAMGDDGIPAQRTFIDFVMRNYDIRALKDDAGTIQMYYSFPTRGILIIAESPYTFTEALSRLQASRHL